MGRKSKTSIDGQTRLCGRCEEWRPVFEFYVTLRKRNGTEREERHSECKRCVGERSAAYYAANRERRRAYDLAHREEKLAYYRRYNQENKDRLRDYVIRKKYGISLVEFEALFAKQDGECGSCGDPLHRGKGGLAVDHRHFDGKVRGILCCSCNIAIGLLKEDPERFVKAVEYLRKFEAVAAKT